MLQASFVFTVESLEFIWQLLNSDPKDVKLEIDLETIRNGAKMLGILRVEAFPAKLRTQIHRVQICEYLAIKQSTLITIVARRSIFVPSIFIHSYSQHIEMDNGGVECQHRLIDRSSNRGFEQIIGCNVNQISRLYVGECKVNYLTLRSTCSRLEGNQNEFIIVFEISSIGESPGQRLRTVRAAYTSTILDFKRFDNAKMTPDVTVIFR